MNKFTIVFKQVNKIIEVNLYIVEICRVICYFA